MAKNNNLVNIAEFSIRNAEGGIDISATLAKFEGVLKEIDGNRVDYSEKVSVALGALFDKEIGFVISMENLPTLALIGMEGVTPSNAKELSEAVLEYVRRSSDFDVSRGRRGGVRRIADMDEKSYIEYEARISKVK
jgi:hypothetical protein